MYRITNLSCLLFRSQLGRSIAKKLWQSLTTSILPVLKSFIQRWLRTKASRTAKAALKYTTTERRSCSSCSCWTSQLCSADINGLYFDDGSVYIYTVSNVTTDRKSRFAKRNHRPAAAMTGTAWNRNRFWHYYILYFRRRPTCASDAWELPWSALHSKWLKLKL